MPNLLSLKHINHTINMHASKFDCKSSLRHAIHNAQIGYQSESQK